MGAKGVKEGEVRGREGKGGEEGVFVMVEWKVVMLRYVLTHFMGL